MGRADERDARLVAGARKFRVFGQEPITGMDGVHLAAFGEIDDGRDVQISGQRAFVFPDPVGFVRARAVQAVGILLGIDRNRAQVQVITGPENALRNLAAVGHEDFFKLPDYHGRSVLS